MNEPEIDLNFPNIKYVNKNGEEAVFNKVSGKWVEDGINDATYNIAGLDESIKSNYDNFYHLFGENSDVIFRSYVNRRGKLNYSVYEDYLKRVGDE